MTDIPEVLFVCTHNAGRSQMAAALLDHEAAGRVRVTSAGSQPADQLNPVAVHAMAEIGIDISREIPKRLTTENVQAADIVITMGCGDACPVYPGKRYLDWDLPDPAGLDLVGVRPIRDRIRELVRTLQRELTNGDDEPRTGERSPLPSNREDPREDAQADRDHGGHDADGGNVDPAHQSAPADDS
ncbi:MAG: arsenate reductase ArsC [Streptosporangiaceae bacterium]